MLLFLSLILIENKIGYLAILEDTSDCFKPVLQPAKLLILLLGGLVVLGLVNSQNDSMKADAMLAFIGLGLGLDLNTLPDLHVHLSMLKLDDREGGGQAISGESLPVAQHQLIQRQNVVVIMLEEDVGLRQEIAVRWPMRCR